MLFNEWRLYFSYPVVWLACILLLAFAVMSISGVPNNISSEHIDVIKKLSLKHISFLMLSLPLAVVALAPAVFLRDNTANIQELINVTPVTKTQRLLMRYLAFTCLLCVFFSLALFSQLIFIAVKVGFTSNLFWLTLKTILVLVIPSIAFLSALALWLSQRFTNTILLYASFAGLWFGYIILAEITGSPVLMGSNIANQSLFLWLQWLDPYAFTTITAQFQEPLSQELTQRSIPKQLQSYYLANGWQLNFTMIVNRILYLVAAVGLFYLGILTSLKDKVRSNTHVIRYENKNYQLNNLKLLTTVVNFFSAVYIKININRQFITLYQTYLSVIFKQRFNQLLFILWLGIIFEQISSGLSFVEPMMILEPNSIDALNRIVWDTVPMIGLLLIAVWSWQICCHDKNVGIAEIIAANAIKSSVFIVSQLAALLTILLILLLLTAIAASLVEWWMQSYWLPLYYLKTLSLIGLPMAIISSFFVAIHHLCKRAFIAGIVILTLLFIKFSPVMASLGLKHPLWNIGGSPLKAADNFWLYSGSYSVYWPFILCWLSITATVLSFAIKYSHRGTGLTGFKQKHNNNYINYPFIFSFLSLVFVSALHYKLNDEKLILSGNDKHNWQANYERNYQHWRNIPQLDIHHINADIALHPTQQKAQLAFTLQLKNNKQQPVTELLIGRPLNLNNNQKKIKLALGNSNIIKVDKELSQTIFRFVKPVQPGEMAELYFEIDYDQAQLSVAKLPNIIKQEFSYLSGASVLPTIGFNPKLTLYNNILRKAYDLPELRKHKPSVAFSISRSTTNEDPRDNHYKWASLTTRISTELGQQAISQGELIKQWQQDERAYFEYKTSEPIRYKLAWFSIPLSIKHHSNYDDKNNIALSVYSPNNRGKSDSIKLNLQAMADTLTWFKQNIVPYKAKQLTMLATPELNFSGYALPQIILINHKVGFRSKPAPYAEFDQRYRRAVHETAHQWFGHNIGNGVLYDRLFLVESMAKYIELVLVEKRQGIKAMKALVAYEKQRFRVHNIKNVNKTIALVDAISSGDVYSRATLVFAKLRDLLGDKIIINTLKELWIEHSYPASPANSMDFVRILLTHSPISTREQITELLLGVNTEALLL